MAKYSVWILEALNISVSGGKSLDGITQGDGSHLPGETITLENGNWLETSIKDNDRNFDDNDNQRLQGDQTINGTNYGNNTKVEAEYSLTLQDPDTGETYEAVSYNVNDSSPAYGTVEGLAFLGPPQGWPPVGKPLNVIDARQGPGSVAICARCCARRSRARFSPGRRTSPQSRSRPAPSATAAPPAPCGSRPSIACCFRAGGRS